MADNFLKRREWLWTMGAASAGALLVGCRRAGREEDEGSDEEKAKEISPVEDLMREHGVLNRILLIYEDAWRKLGAKKDVNLDALGHAAGIIRKFVEDYHEKLEEDHLFPRFEKVGKLTDLVGTLRAQHQAGRRLTEQVAGLAKLPALKNAGDRQKLQDALAAFVRMYRPHEAREDTVLFPALRTVVSAHEYGALGEQFEDTEHKLFGEDGFEKYVDEVAGLEKQLGLYDLAQFTPPA
jgi:hemerythrin-like domain-containing protein